MKGIRTLLVAFVGIVGGRMAYEFLDEILGLDRAARSAARGVSS